MRWWKKTRTAIPPEERDVLERYGEFTIASADAIRSLDFDLFHRISGCRRA
jgi:hypothetical protein